MPTSLTYDFADITADRVIVDAFAQIGRSSALISGWQYKMARESLNFVLSSWLSKKGLNLFTVEQDMIQIIPGQYTYALPKNTSKILECVLAKANLVNISGQVPGCSANGDPETVFTNATPRVVCDASTGIDPGAMPYISINYPIPQPIQYVGISVPSINPFLNPPNPTPLGPLRLKLDIQSSTLTSVPIADAPSSETWITNLSIPEQEYYSNQTYWFSLPFTQSANNWRIIETGGNPLYIQQIQMDIPFQSQKMSRIGRDSYVYNPVNNTQGVSTSYYMNRNRQPTLNLWQTPSTSNGWQFFLYNRVRSIQDVGDYTNSLDMTPRFLNAATTGLAAELSRRFAPDSYDSLQTRADEMFSQAAKEDTENVDMQLNISSGYMGS